MPSLLTMLKARLEPSTHSDDEIKQDIGNGRAERFHNRPRSLASSSQSAACRSLYKPARPAVNKQRYEWRGGYCEKHRHTEGEVSEEVDDDPVIKHSMYPQMIGKRRSELTPARTRSVKYNRPTTRRQEAVEQRSARLRGYSVDSEYESDGNPEGRPVRVCMYPQAKYIEDVDAPPQSEQRKSGASSVDVEGETALSPTFERSSLPSEEYHILVRRQKMARAREVLEPHLANRNPRPNNATEIWHGRMQGFTIRNSERRRLSRAKYAVRKALKAGLELTDAGYKLALHRHADKVYFCELSDVDGRPIDKAMIEEFTRLFQEAHNEAYVAKPPSQLSGHPHPITWMDDCAPKKAANLREMSSDVGLNIQAKRPQFVSKFSWDSSDGEMNERRRLTKTQRNSEAKKHDTIKLGTVKVHRAIIVEMAEPSAPSMHATILHVENRDT